MNDDDIDQQIFFVFKSSFYLCSFMVGPRTFWTPLVGTHIKVRYNTSYVGIYDRLIGLSREHIYNISDQIQPFRISTRTRALVLQSVNVTSDFHRRS